MRSLSESEELKMAERRQTSEDRKRERKTSKTAKPKKKKSWLKRIFLTVLLLGLALFIAGVSLFAYYASSAPELDEELLKYPLSSEFYDVNGELFAKFGEEKRTFVAYDDIPQGMIDAIIATEDVRFYEHSGMDFYRLGGAVVANFRDGFGAQGASTITQQVVKNAFLKNEKKLKRKAQEAWLSFKLEREYSKEEIFEMYFNRVLMSGTVYGFGTAAQYFYGKELDELTLGEMAQLAGMPQSPNNYNPFTNPENAEKRRDIVLSLMVQHGKITQAEADEAKKVSVADSVLSEEQRKETTTKYPAFLSLVLDELRENGDYELLSEGIKVYTTLDPKAQEKVENIMNNSENFPTETIQSGVAVVDTKTGAVRAVGGGRNYDTRLNTNYATQMKKRSPGSTAKPLVAYGPAIENLKWSTGETTVDERMTYPNTKQVITNADGRYNGTMTIRQALYTSRNVPAVKTLIEVGTDKSKEFLNNLGIYPDNVYPSSALGPEIHVSPVEMAAAYAAFGNNGVFTKSHSITKIVYRDGETSKSYEQSPNVAMSDYTAYMITDMLRDTVSNLSGATGTNANVSGIDLAGKTGTSNYSGDDFDKFNLPSSAVPDSWFVGYTTDYSIAIWSGYEKYSDPITTWPERRLPQTLFKSIMTSIVKENGRPSQFKKPSSVVEATIEVGTNPVRLASEFTPSNLKRTELFVKGTQPTKTSEKYDKPDIGSVSGLNAVISKDAKSINLSWNYNASSSDEGEEAQTPTFNITMSVNGGAATKVASTDSLSYSIPNITSGSTYTITVTPSVAGVSGSPASTTISVPSTEQVPGDRGNGSDTGSDTDTDKDTGTDTDTETETTPPSTTPPNNNGNSNNNSGNSNNNNNNNNNSVNGIGNRNNQTDSDKNSETVNN